MLLPTIGSRLRRQRLARGLTQAALATAAGVSPRFLVQLEKGEGNISVQRLYDVCGALDLPLEALVRGLGPDTREKLALVGLRGAGKSTVGARLAARLGAPFVELDRLVEDAAGMNLGEIFEIRGQDGYREIEGRVLDDVLARPGRAVLATGGSLVTAPETWARLRETARTAWLMASPESHLRRVTAQGDLRPMRGRPDALAELEAILTAREPLYGLADVHLDTDALGVDGVVERLAAW
jgi:XRE family aerobic/anaerobic benzoate catabolism transcriptional regulator